MQPRQFISAHDLAGRESAPFVVGKPHTIVVAEIVRIFSGPKFVMVETTVAQSAFNGSFHDLARIVRKQFHSVEIQTEQGVQLLNLNAVAAVLLSDVGSHECGLTSGTILRDIYPTVLIDSLPAVSHVEQVKWGRSTWHVARRHVIGLDNSHIFVRGGHQLRTSEPIETVAQRLAN
jgi:hypothetical protein